jgi:hypothetical protein
VPPRILKKTLLPLTPEGRRLLAIRTLIREWEERRRPKEGPLRPGMDNVIKLGFYETQGEYFVSTRGHEDETFVAMDVRRSKSSPLLMTLLFRASTGWYARIL